LTSVRYRTSLAKLDAPGFYSACILLKQSANVVLT
jgi:hypothetical protein